MPETIRFLIVGRPVRGLTWLLLLGAPILGSACAGPAGLPERPNILLITVDTLRADHLSSYGYERRTSPVLDALGAEGVRFDQVAVQWPKTSPSFASIFTATYPKTNGIVKNWGIHISEQLDLLAEGLQREGYSTHAVVANAAVASEFNFDQGFETYIETWKLDVVEGRADPNRAEGVTDLALAVAKGLPRDRPFFLWVHYLDPHFPYDPPGAWSDLFQDDEWFDSERRLRIDWERDKRDVMYVGADQVLEGREDLAFYVARYDAEIAYSDAQIGELLTGLRAHDRMQNTLTVVTSDHGESLGDHEYYFDHGKLGYQTCLRVPLVFHFPGVLEPAIDPDPVELLHLAPTLLDIAGVELEDGRWMQGRSLVPRLLGEEVAAHDSAYAFSEAGYGRWHMWQRIVRDRRYKLIDAREGSAQRWITGGVGRQFALFDLVEDPDETVNVVDDNPEVADRLRSVLGRWFDTPFEIARDEPEEATEMSDETRDQLRALGYLE